MKQPLISRRWQALFCLFACIFCLSASNISAKSHVYDVKRWGIVPSEDVNCSPLMQQALKDIAAEVPSLKGITLVFGPGEYHFLPEGSAEKTYYISNHDQANPKRVGLAFEGFDGLIIKGEGADFVFHGRMLPLAVLHSRNVELRDLSIDFKTPHISQIEVVKNDHEGGITFRVAPWVNYRLTDEGNAFEAYGEGWTLRPGGGIAFEGKTRHVVYNTGDIGCNLRDLKDLGGRTLHAPNWKDKRMVPGTVVALRGWGRPTPGIFLSHNTNTLLKNVKIHYAEGMGLLAQVCDGITLDGSGVCLKGEDDPRYFTTQADATHFSGCKGLIRSVNGLYEGMMDDAINVHGTYLKVVERIDDHTLKGRYMHHQSWGFDWGFTGDEVQFIRSATMEIVGPTNRIARIEPADKPTTDGAKEFIITFEQPLEAEISAEQGYGIENLTWTPRVYFAGNTIRNNRARGALFSTPRRTVVERNLFDHTSGTGILLCGDCNGWYETGACRDVVIRNNTFINALTCQYQFTNAVISIYPEIPNLEGQQKLFHGGKKNAIRITGNTFNTFDAPILYAKSVDGLLFKKNTIIQNNDYAPMHWNRERYWLQNVRNVTIQGVLFDHGGILKEVKLPPVGD